MTRKQALIELRDKVKAGNLVPDSLIVDEETSEQIELAVNLGPLHGDCWADFLNAYDGSLDAAKSLHDAVLSGWTVEKLCEWHRDGQSVGWGAVLRQHVDPPATISAGLFGTNPARAWLLAILEALISQEPDT